VPPFFKSTTPATAQPQQIDNRWVAAVSLLLSLWLTAIDPVINRDAIIYLLTAEAYLREGIGASHALFDRPLLSICIAHLHQLSSLSLAHSGLVLNAAFYALLCTSFVTVTRHLGGNRQVQLLAALVILSHPMLNNYRSSIMRDPAFWAFVMLSFQHLLLFAKQPNWRNQLAWLAAIFVATAFRFEGLMFALLAPAGLLFTHRAHRWRACLRLLASSWAVVALGAAVLYGLQPATQENGDLFPAIGNYFARMQSFPQQFQALAQDTGATLLEFSAQEDAAVAAIAGLLAILALNILRAVTLPLIGLQLWGWWQRWHLQLKPRHRALLNTHLLLALGYLAIFTLLNRFMLERYAGILTLFILPYLVFFLYILWTHTERRLPRYLIVLLLVGMWGDSLHNSDYKKAYIRDAASWLRDHTPSDACLMSNELYIAYFSEREYDWSTWSAHDFRVADFAARPELWRNCDYLAVEIKRREEQPWQDMLQQYKLRELKVFKGQRSRIAIVETIATP
jgi:hypothetical protein